VNAVLKEPKLLPVYWSGLAIAILALDYLTEPVIQFPILFLFPVILASWYGGRWWGLCFAISLPIVREHLLMGRTLPAVAPAAGIEVVVRILVLSTVALLVDRTATQARLLAREARALSGLLPICSVCKKIRDDESVWQPLELFISRHSEALLSHSLCPDCTRGQYDESADRMRAARERF
jgi:K+-sensing histidine kinase KdpD